MYTHTYSHAYMNTKELTLTSSSNSHDLAVPLGQNHGVLLRISSFSSRHPGLVPVMGAWGIMVERFGFPSDGTFGVNSRPQTSVRVIFLAREVVSSFNELAFTCHTSDASWNH